MDAGQEMKRLKERMDSRNEGKMAGDCLVELVGELCVVDAAAPPSDR